MCELNLTPKEYYSLTLRQFEILSEGHKRKLAEQRATQIDSWRQTRLIAYLIAKPNLKDQFCTLYQFYPLPDDPTKEEMERELKESQEKDGKWMASVIENFRKVKRK